MLSGYAWVYTKSKSLDALDEGEIFKFDAYYTRKWKFKEIFHIKSLYNFNEYSWIENKS